MSRRDMAMALIVMVIWGFNFAVAKFGLREFSPMFLMCLRFTSVAVVLLPFVRVPWGQMKEIFILSVLLGSLHFPLMFTGLTGVDAATASIAIQLQCERPRLVDQISHNGIGATQMLESTFDVSRIQRHDGFSFHITSLE